MKYDLVVIAASRGGIQALDEVMAHPQTQALGMLQDAPDGSISLMGLPVSFNGARPPLRTVLWILGSDQAAVFCSIDPSRPVGQT